MLLTLLAPRVRAGDLLPHAPALLPQSLRAGLASLDEQALAALGFEHLVFVRPAQLGRDAASAHTRRPTLAAGHRLARALLSARPVLADRSQMMERYAFLLVE